MVAATIVATLEASGRKEKAEAKRKPKKGEAEANMLTLEDLEVEGSSVVTMCLARMLLQEQLMVEAEHKKANKKSWKQFVVMTCGGAAQMRQAVLRRGLMPGPGKFVEASGQPKDEEDDKEADAGKGKEEAGSEEKSSEESSDDEKPVGLASRLQIVSCATNKVKANPAYGLVRNR